MGRKNGKELQEVLIDWEGAHEHQRAMLASGRFQVAAQLTQIRFAHGVTPEEVVADFTKIDDLLEDWYRGTPLKKEIKGLLDIMYPDPPGFEASTLTDTVTWPDQPRPKGRTER